MPRQKSAVTIYTVAERAHVAISTVSRVLNDAPDVADATRERVLEAIEALKFRPHRGAKALAQRRLPSVAIAIPTFTTPFHNELLKGIRIVLMDHEMDLLLFDLGSKNPRARLLSLLKRGTMDGLILAGIPVNPGLAAELQALRACVVLIGHHHTHFDCLYWDNATGTRIAVDHLIERGHRRIGMIRAFTDSYLQQLRVRGFLAALAGAGLRADEAPIRSGTTQKHAGFTEEHGYEAMKDLLAADPPVTAVFASSDVQAIGAWLAIREAGLSVPEDIALVGYDDVKTSAYVGLSSVDQNMEGVGRLAAKRLLWRLENKGTTGRIDHRVVPELRIRESSAPRRSAQSTQPTSRS